MGSLFALQGTSNCGKSETLNNVVKILSNKYPNADINIIINRKDKKVIFYDINGLTVGIEPQGDPNSRLEESLFDFSKESCDIIFCACRTSGMTVQWVNNLSKKYKINFIKQKIVYNNQKKSNWDMAESLIQLSGL